MSVELLADSINVCAFISLFKEGTEDPLVQESLLCVLDTTTKQVFYRFKPIVVPIYPNIVTLLISF